MTPTTNQKSYYVRLEIEADRYTMTYVPAVVYASDEDEAIRKASTAARSDTGHDGWMWTAVEEV